MAISPAFVAISPVVMVISPANSLFIQNTGICPEALVCYGAFRPNMKRMIRASRLHTVQIQWQETNKHK